MSWGRAPIDQNSELELIDASSIRPEPIDWLWPGWLARGKLHILAGAPSTGKTTLTLAMAAIITRGTAWPDGAPTAPGRVVIWSGEDDPADTLTPRLLAAGADTERVHFVGSVHEDNGARTFDPATDVGKLAEALAKLPEPPSLLIVDPIVSAVAGDSHKNAETRRALAPLVNLAQLQGCALVGITHFTKGTAGREPLDRVTGSLAFGALARIVLVTARRPDDHPEGPARLLVRAKSNIGIDGGGVQYHIDETELALYPGLCASHVRWGAPIEGTARSLLISAETLSEDGVETPPSAPEKKRAETWLREFLSSGPLPSQQVIKEAAREGISERTLHRARNALKVESVCAGFGKDRQSKWAMPKGTFSASVPAICQQN